MNGTSVLEVAHQINIQILERSLRFVDGVEVEHRLRGVLVGTVTGIYDRNRRHLAGISRRPFQIVPHHDDIGIITYHFDGIFQRFPFRRAGGFGVSETDNTCTEPVGRCFKTQTGAGGGFEEQGCHYFAFEQPAVGMLFKLFRHFEHIENFLFRMFGNGY